MHRQRLSQGAGLLICGIVAATCAYGEPARLGVLVGPGLAERGLGDLVTVSLSGDPDLVLVEREQVDAALRELEVNAALGADATGTRLKLGAMLHADLLALLALEAEEGGEYVRLVICDTRIGARLDQDRLPLADGAEAAAETIAARVRAVQARFASGVERVVAVPPFVSRSLAHDLDHLQRRLAHILEGSFAALPGTATLEVEEVRAIRRELEIGGTTLRARVVPWFVSGEFRIEVAAAGADAKVELLLVLTDGGEVQRECRRDFAAVEALARFLREDAVGELIGQTAAPAPLSVEQQVARMEEQASALERLGEFDLAADVREACLLFAPEHVATMLCLVERYATRVGARPSPAWYRQPIDRVREAWTTLLPRWRRAVELAERLIQHGLITQYEALSLYVLLHENMRWFVRFGPDDPPQMHDVDDPELLAILDRELAACTAAMRRFQQHAYLLIPELPLGTPERALTSLVHGQEPGGLWHDRLFEYPVYRRARAAQPENGISVEVLAHCAEAAAKVPSSEHGLCYRLLSMLESYVTDAPAYHSAREEDFERFLSALEATGDPLDATYAGYGRLLLQRFRVPSDRRRPVSELSDEAARLDQDFRRLAGTAPSRLLQMRRDWSQTKPTGGEEAVVGLTHTPPKAETLSPHEETAGGLRLERVPLVVRRLDGRTEQFSELSWAEQPGFVSEWGAPFGFKQCDVACDLVWSASYALVQREPGVLDVLLLDREADLRSVEYDGTYIWIASRRLGIQVFDAGGELVRTIDAQAGLPAHDGELILTPLEPGRAFATGSFGPQNRAWCAVLDVSRESDVVDVILEATQRETPEPQRPLLYAADAELLPVERTFIPWRLYTYRDPYAGNRRVVIVDRRPARNHRMPLLWFDPCRRTARATAFVAPDPRRNYWYDVFLFFLPDGNWLVPEDELITRSVRGDERNQPVYEDLHVKHTSVMWGPDGYLYAPSRDYWARLDPETLAAESLGPLPQLRPSAGDGLYVTTSAHFGIVAFTETGKLFAIRIDAREAAPSDTATEPVRAVRVVCAETQAPLGGAAVEFERGALRRLIAVDEAGRTAVPAGFESAVARALADGYESRWVVLHDGHCPGAVAGTVTLAVPAALHVEGRVLSSEGEPLARTAVRVKLVGENDWDREAVAKTETDEEGHWSLTLPNGVRDRLRLLFGEEQDGQRILSPVAAHELSQMQHNEHVLHMDFDHPDHIRVDSRWGCSVGTGSRKQMEARRVEAANTPRAPENGPPEVVWHVSGTVQDAATGEPIGDFQAGLAEVAWAAQAAHPKPKYQAFVGGQLDLYEKGKQTAYEVWVQAEGYLPVHIALPTEGDTDIHQDITLHTHPGLRVRVARQDGSPAVGAGIVSTTSEVTGVRVPVRRVLFGDRTATTGADGTAMFPPFAGQFQIAAADETGYAIASADEQMRELSVVLGPWGGIEGTWQLVPDGLPEVFVTLQMVRETSPDKPFVAPMRFATTVDSDGHYAFPRLIPGEYELVRDTPRMGEDARRHLNEGRNTFVVVPPGEQVRVDIPARGRPVRGRIVSADGSPLRALHTTAHLYVHPTIEKPENWEQMTRAEQGAWSRGKAKNATLMVDSAGGFLANEVVPGTYRLIVQGTSVAQEGSKRLDFELRGVEVPGWEEGQTPTWLDLGEINVKDMIDRTALGRRRPTVRHTPRKEPQEPRDWETIGLRCAGGAAALGAIAVAAYRRRRARALARKLSNGGLPALLLALLLCGTNAARSEDQGECGNTARLLPVVEAVEAFKRDCGLWPQRLEDLQPRYLDTLPAGCTYHWSWSDYVYIEETPGGRPSEKPGLSALGGGAGDRSIFVFCGDDRGWYAGRPGRYRPCVGPKIRTAGQSRPWSEVLPAAIEEFDRRIAREPKETDHRRAKFTFLLEGRAFDAARQAALEWVDSNPRKVDARCALAAVARKESSGFTLLVGKTDVQYKILRTWRDREHHSYGLWRVFAQPGSDGSASTQLPRYLAGPIAADRTEWLYAELFLLEDASCPAMRRKPEQLLALCARWEAAAADFKDPPPDRSITHFGSWRTWDSGSRRRPRPSTRRLRRYLRPSRRGLIRNRYRYISRSERTCPTH